jgi:hypothetical protein
MKQCFLWVGSILLTMLMIGCDMDPVQFEGDLSRLSRTDSSESVDGGDGGDAADAEAADSEDGEAR